MPEQAPGRFWHLGFIPARLGFGLRWLRRWNRMSPPALFMASFMLLIAIGTAGLMWIPGLQNGERLGFVDSLFTITSAVCVTGLTVVDTATHFTGAGQLWILLFIQLGGLGLISLTTLIIGAMGARLSLRSEMLTLAPTQSPEKPQVWRIALGVAKFSLIVEAAGAFVLFCLWAFEHPVHEAAWHAVFHSISAYCNAGFSTFSDSLIGENGLVLVVISLLIIVGGLGYLTFEELIRRRRSTRVRRISSHTWVVVVMTSVLLLGGWIVFAVFEWNNSLAGMPIHDKLVGSWFLSVTPRTAGFNAIDYGSAGNDTLVLTCMLMFVGGSPGSTAGGVKTTTIAVLLSLGLSRVRGRRFVGLKDRTIPEGTIERTISIILLSVFVLTVAFFLLSAIEATGRTASDSRALFLPLAFEAMSAFGTVGLSMNLTPTLSTASELLLVWLMFVGRVGLLSFFSAMVMRRSHATSVRPAQEDVFVG